MGFIFRSILSFIDFFPDIIRFNFLKYTDFIDENYLTLVCICENLLILSTSISKNLISLPKKQ